MLEEQGALILDCDAIYHDLLLTSDELLGEISSAFPGTAANGTLDRRALAAKVFADDEALQCLNQITHRYVCDQVIKLLRRHAMRGGTLAAIDAVELISSGLSERCTTTLAILADAEKRAARIMARDHIALEAAMARIRAQRSDDYYQENCEHTLWNNADQQQFEQDCRQLFKEILNHG